LVIENLVKVISNPNVNEALEALRDAISRRRVVLLVGACIVSYKGRASSELGLGDRIVLIKEDGSILVHRPRGYEPVNWQPPKCLFNVHLDGDNLAIRAIRQKPRETLQIRFKKIYFLSVMTLEDAGEFSLYATEEDMKKAILLRPSIIEEGLRLVKYEKKVEPGFIDLYGVDEEGRLVVIEIKRRTAGRDAVLQLARYVESIRTNVKRDVRGILVAPKLARGVQRMLVSLGLDFKELNPKTCAKILKRYKTKKLSEFTF